MPCLLSFSYPDKGDKHSLPASPCFPLPLPLQASGSCSVLPQLSAVGCWTTPLEQWGVKWLVEHNLICSCWWRRNSLTFPTHISQTGLGSEPLDPPSSQLPPCGPGGSFSIFPEISSHCMEAHTWARSKWHCIYVFMFFSFFKCVYFSHIVCRSAFVYFSAQPGLFLRTCQKHSTLNIELLMITSSSKFQLLLTFPHQ